MTKNKINWKSMHQHLAKIQHKLEKKEKTMEETIQILHQRAEELAKETVATDKQDGVEMIEFTLGSEHYGIESIHVSHVCKAKNITHLPSTPEFIEGIINIHGRLVCVINLKQLFGITKLPVDDMTRILIINHDDINLGIMADAVTRCEPITLETLQKSLPTLTGVRSEFLMGITHDQKIILNVEKLISYKEFMINDLV